MSWLELNSALSAAVFRKRLEEPREYSFVSKFSLTECRGKPQIVELLKTEGEAWETIMSCKKSDEEVKAFEKRVRNQLGTVPFKDIIADKGVHVSALGKSDQAQDVSDCKEEMVVEEVKQEEEEQKPFVFDKCGSPRLLKKEDPGSHSEDEDDIGEPTENLENLNDVIAGRANLSFNRFKSLMESGQLTLNDLDGMRNVRLVEVGGRGQVVQFLATSAKDFNKVNLKELSLDDAKPTNNIVGKKALKKMKGGEMIATQVQTLVTELMSKKGTVFTCDPCRKKFPGVPTVLDHIETIHASMVNQIRVAEDTGEKAAKKNKKKLRQMLKVGLHKICDPNLQIEQVMVTNPDVKAQRKGESGKNTFQMAADLLSSLILLERWKESGQKRPQQKIMYICKACDTDTYLGKKARRDACIEHIEHYHRDKLVAWAEQMETTPGQQFKFLLVKALAPGFMFKAM